MSATSGRTVLRKPRPRSGSIPGRAGARCPTVIASNPFACDASRSIFIKENHEYLPVEVVRGGCRARCCRPWGLREDRSLPSRNAEADRLTFRSVERLAEDWRPGEGRGELCAALNPAADRIEQGAFDRR